ncbi:MAG: hypothetical protein Q4G26_09255 [Paracoccus sp. (in: a-proteobacteria)]|nr:hypothetical protein [Paracoccus sp. (in: a-proteobacteria)]
MPDLTLADMIAEGEALSRPCFLLRADATGDIAGFWGGERADQPSRPPPEATALSAIRHIMTVDARLLGQLGLPAPAPSIGFSEVRLKTGAITFRVHHSGPEIAALECDGLPLYATPATSFPPFAALCLYGGARIADWLAGLGLRRHEYHAAAHVPLAMDYEDAFTARAPISGSGADAVLGGWHQIWPEDDFFLPLEMRLAALTLREAEPWYELWRASGPGNWSVRARMT